MTTTEAQLREDAAEEAARDRRESRRLRAVLRWAHHELALCARGHGAWAEERTGFVLRAMHAASRGAWDEVPAAALEVRP